MNNSYQVSDLDLIYIKYNDLNEIAGMLRKPAVCEHVFFGPNSEEETLIFYLPFINSIADSLSRQVQPKEHIFTIRRKKIFVGVCALLPVICSPGNYSIAYVIDEPFWGKGYAGLTCSFLIDFGFNQLNAHRISGDCMDTNIVSRKIMEKNGFILEGCQKKYWNKNNTYYDNLLFGLVKDKN